MDIQTALNWRYGAKKLLPDKIVPQETVDRILEAARKAPSSQNLQPWKLIVISDKPFQQRLQTVCDNQQKVGQASHIVVIAARTRWNEQYAEQLARLTAETRKLTPAEEALLRAKLVKSVLRRSGEKLFAWTKQQSFIALGFLLFAAALEKVDAGPMGGFSRKGVDELLGLTDTEYSTAVVVALGYRDETDKYAHLPKVRRSKNDVIEHRS